MFLFKWSGWWVSGIVSIYLTDGDSAAVCEIIHVKSESEGRPERVFHLCCRSERRPKPQGHNWHNTHLNMPTCIKVSKVEEWRLAICFQLDQVDLSIKVLHRFMLLLLVFSSVMQNTFWPLTPLFTYLQWFSDSPHYTHGGHYIRSTSSQTEVWMVEALNV